MSNCSRGSHGHQGSDRRRLGADARAADRDHQWRARSRSGRCGAGSDRRARDDQDAEPRRADAGRRNAAHGRPRFSRSPDAPAAHAGDHDFLVHRSRFRGHAEGAGTGRRGLPGQAARRKHSDAAGLRRGYSRQDPRREHGAPEVDVTCRRTAGADSCPAQGKFFATVAERKGDCDRRLDRRHRGDQGSAFVRYRRKCHPSSWCSTCRRPSLPRSRSD
jgi:hypothetical protein